MRENTIGQRRWPLWTSLIVLFSAFCIQYYGDFGNLLKRWDNEDFSYCYLIPFVFLYLVYTKRQYLKKHELRPSLWGVGVLLFSGILYWMGRLGSIETLTYAAIWVAVIGLILLILGIQIVKLLAFPLLILGFIVPAPPFLNNLIV